MEYVLSLPENYVSEFVILHLGMPTGFYSFPVMPEPMREQFICINPLIANYTRWLIAISVMIDHGSRVTNGSRNASNRKGYQQSDILPGKTPDA
jgi:hypothetical protein